jgi:hypothetical protein
MRLGASAENGYTSVHVSSGWLILRGASGNNLKHLDAAIPVGLFTCVTGVSGSGKSTLIQDTLYPRLLYVEDADYREALWDEDDLGAQRLLSGAMVHSGCKFLPRNTAGARSSRTSPRIIPIPKFGSKKKRRLRASVIGKR